MLEVTANTIFTTLVVIVRKATLFVKYLLCVSQTEMQAS